MAEAIIRDKKATISCCAYCDSQYNIGGAFVGTPAILGASGVEKIIELDLNPQEKQALDESVAHVKELIAKVDSLL